MTQEVSSIPIGSKVKIFTTEDEVYTGRVLSNYFGTQRIVFDRMVSDTHEMYDSLRFCYDEIRSFEILKRGPGHLNLPKHKDIVLEIISQCQKKPEVPNHLKGLNLEQDDDTKHYANGIHKDMDSYAGLAEIDNSCDFTSLGLNLPMKHHIIDDLDGLENALGVLECERVVALAVEGTPFKRNGNLFWILMASYEHVFMFDMLALKNEPFDKGLRAIFESPHIQKVIHDCRFIADIFKHEYNCNLVNVFDTQVAAAFIEKENTGGEFSNKMDSYPKCVMKYVDVAPEYVYIQKFRRQLMRQDLSMWTDRPLPESMKFAAIKEVIYLLELRTVLHEKLMEPFMFGVSVFMSSLRDCDEEERKIAYAEPGELPSMFREFINYHKKEKLHTLQLKNNKRPIQLDLYSPKDEHQYNKQIYTSRHHDIYYDEKRHKKLVDEQYAEINGRNNYLNGIVKSTKRSIDALDKRSKQHALRVKSGEPSDQQGNSLNPNLKCAGLNNANRTIMTQEDRNRLNSKLLADQCTYPQKDSSNANLRQGAKPSRNTTIVPGEINKQVSIRLKKSDESSDSQENLPNSNINDGSSKANKIIRSAQSPHLDHQKKLETQGQQQHAQSSNHTRRSLHSPTPVLNSDREIAFESEKRHMSIRASVVKALKSQRPSKTRTVNGSSDNSDQNEFGIIVNGHLQNTKAGKEAAKQPFQWPIFEEDSEPHPFEKQNVRYRPAGLRC